MNLLWGQEEQILYSAVTFRCLLDSLARPGKVNRLAYPTFFGEPPCYRLQGTSSDIPLNLYALGALWTLLDREVSFVLAVNGEPLGHNTSTTQWLTLRSGARVAAPNAADFAFFCDGRSGGLLTELNRGSLLEPESSATAIYCVERLIEAEQRSGLTLALAGPGIQKKRVISVIGLDEGEVELIGATQRNYPLGIDIYLIDRSGLCVGLPRTTNVLRLQPIADA